MRTRLILLAACALVLIGCSADEADDGSNGSEGSDSGDDTGTSVGTSGASQSETSAATEPQSGTSTSAGTGETGVEDGTSTEDSSSASVDGDSTGASDPCVGLPRDECQANDGCVPLDCAAYEMTGDAMWCIAGPEFVGCQSADIGCDDVRMFACMGDDAPVYRCPSSCIPAGWTECAPPVEGEVPMCP